MTGPINSGKTTYLMDLLAGNQPGDGVYIVPSEVTALTLSRKAMTSERSALIGDVFLSWDRFLTNLADPRRPKLSRLELSLFIQGIMADHPMRYFKSKRPGIGIAAQFADTIVALKKNGVSAPRLRQILETRGSLKENDLLTLFECYEKKRVELNLLDEGDLLGLALDGIKSTGSSYLEQVQMILMDEFHHITPGQLILIKAIKDSFSEKDVRISAPTTDDIDSIYADYLNANLSEISKLASDVVKLETSNHGTPEIINASSRSMLQEARAVADLIGCSTGGDHKKHNEIVLATRSGDSFMDQFLIEAGSKDMLLATPTNSSAMNAPIIHEMLSIDTTERWPMSGTISEYVEICRSYIRADERIAKWSEELSLSETERPLTSRSLSAISSLEQLLYKLKTTVSITGIETITRESFVHLIVEELSGQVATEGGLDNLLPCRHFPIESPMAITASEVFIPRMVEGTIPRIQTERLFFAEADRHAAEPDNTLDAIFPNAEESLASESYIFETFMAKCRKKITFTRPSIDDSGTELSPSAFLDGIEDEYFIAPTSARSSAQCSPDWPNRMNLISAIESSRASETDDLNAWKGILTDESARAIVRERFTNSTFSATSLQRYAQCPFVFFAEKVLGLKPKDDEMPDLLPKDRGTILHSLLERFYQRHVDIFRAALTDDSNMSRIEDLVDALLDEVMIEHAQLVGRSAEGLRPFQKRSMKTMAMQVIREELKQDRDLDMPLFPMAFEWGFGTTPDNTLMIPVKDDKPAKLKGYIDRIDSDDKRSRFVVVDYKTGQKVDSIKNKMLNGLHMQLPIYVEAVSKFLLPKAKALGGILLAVMLAEKKQGFVLKEYNGVCYNTGRAHSAMDDDTWAQAYSSALGAVAVHVGSIRAGQFKPEPADKCPTHCQFEDVCRFSGTT